MRRLIVFGLILLNSPVFGQNQWVVDSSAVTFKIKNAGIVVNGTFGSVEAEIIFDPKKFKSSQMVAAVDAGSVETGIRIRNNHLRRPDYFYVDSFPQITMKSVNFQKRGEGQFLGDFILYLKGREGKVSVPFSFQNEGGNYIFSGSFEIDRRDFDIGDSSMLLDDMVHVNIWVKAKKE
jgi:polyisoprenoid-binding protein YceI